MSFKKIGPYIKEVDVRNSDSRITLLRGVSTRKVLIESVANMTNVSLHNYKIANKGQFVYVADTSRRGEKIAIALNVGEPCIVSSIYTVFEVIDETELLPEYLFIWFNRSEFDRYARFNSWGSARETFNWDDMCDIEIPIPHIDEQRKYVALYNGLLTNQKVYENSLEDLQLICDTYIENLKNNEAILMRLGSYIKQKSDRNENKIHLPVQGVSNSRMFIETKANTTSLDFSNYKIVSNGDFAYNPSRLNIGSIALRSDGECIISPMYVVFEIIKKEQLLPEYLYLWFRREAFCHYVWFYAFGSVRDTFDWADMCEVNLPIPDIKAQEAIVTIYHTLETRKRINDQLKDTIKPLCPVLMKGVVENTSKLAMIEN